MYGNKSPRDVILISFVLDVYKIGRITRSSLNFKSVSDINGKDYRRKRDPSKELNCVIWFIPALLICMPA